MKPRSEIIRALLALKQYPSETPASRQIIKQSLASMDLLSAYITPLRRAQFLITRHHLSRSWLASQRQRPAEDWARQRRKSALGNTRSIGPHWIRAGMGQRAKLLIKSALQWLELFNHPTNTFLGWPLMLLAPSAQRTAVTTLFKPSALLTQAQSLQHVTNSVVSL